MCIVETLPLANSAPLADRRTRIAVLAFATVAAIAPVATLLAVALLQR